MANLFLDFAAGSDAADGTSFANRVKTITSGATAARQAPGDVWRIKKSPAPVSLGIDALFTNKSDTITLDSALTANISLCTGAWTPSANITSSLSTTRKEGSVSTQVVITAAFTTGMAAYETMAATDFSAYEKISFWIQPSAAVAANALRIDLCSDAAGATPVDSFTIDVALVSGQWHCLTYDKGSALGSSIESVALTVLTDPGTVNVLLDNILACNDLTLTCLVGKDSSETSMDVWPIKSINGTTIKIDQGVASSASATSRGYYGTTETVEIFAREPHMVGGVQSTNEAGTSMTSGLVAFSGGWDETNMTTQEGLTFVRNIAANTNVFSQGHQYIKWDKLVAVGASTGFNIGTSNSELGDVGCIDTTIGVNFASGAINVNISGDVIAQCCSSVPILVTSNIIAGVGVASGISCAQGCSINGIYRAHTLENKNCAGTLNFLNSSGGNGSDIPVVVATDNLGSGVTVDAGIRIRNLVSTDNQSYAINITNSYTVVIQNLTSSGNGTAGIRAGSGGLLLVDNSSIAEATKVTTDTNAGSRVQISRWEGVAGQDRIYEQNVLVIQQQSSVRHTAADVAWQYDPQSIHQELYPLEHKLGYIAQDGGGSITAKLWVRRTNAAGVIKFVCRGGQDDGVTTDQIATISAAVDTWEELSLTFTPTEAVPLLFEVWTYGTGTLYADDFSVT